MKARYRATKTSRTYHRPHCPHVSRWDQREDDLRHLSAADVLRDDLKPCRECQPPPPMGLAPEPESA